MPRSTISLSLRMVFDKVSVTQLAMHCLRHRPRSERLIAALLCVAALSYPGAQAQPVSVERAKDESDGSSPTHLSLLELQNLLADHGQIIRSFRVEGVVCSASPTKNMVVLQDDSASALLRLPSIRPEVTAGKAVAILGTNCSLVRTRFGIEIANPLVVDNDGNHPMVLKSGKAYLSAGRQ